MRPLTPKDLARAIGSSESSVRRWVDGGTVRLSRTVGGHRRITLAEAVRFIRETGSPLVRPELLGLPRTLVISPAVGPAGTEEGRAIAAAVESGDGTRFGALATSWYLSGRTVAELFDGPVREVMNYLGARWRDDEEIILAEHRATEACAQGVAQLRMIMPEPPRDAPLALGAAVEGDTHALASLMAAAVLAEAGYRDVNFGGSTPVKLLSRAAAERRPRLVWLSINVPADSRLVRVIEMLTEQLSGQRSTLVVGGSHALELPGHANRQLARSMSELAAFAQGLRRASPRRPA